jgi:hypothetical protein
MEFGRSISNKLSAGNESADLGVKINAKNDSKKAISVFRETFESRNLSQYLSIDRFIDMAIISKTKVCELQRNFTSVL